MGEGEDTSLLRRRESGGGGKRYVSELENVVGVGMQAYWGDMKCGQSYVSGLKNRVCWVGGIPGQSSVDDVQVGS